MSDEVKLLPCPFPHETKRGPFVECDDEDFDIARVCCGDCGAAGPYVDLTVKGAKAEAARLWNTRAIEATRPTEQDWQPIETFARREGKALIFDPRWGVAEGLRFDGGKWGLAAFNGQIIEAHPTYWQPVPEPPAQGISHD